MPLPGFLQNLTNEGVVDPQTGQVRFYPDAAHAAKALAGIQSQQVRPASADVQGQLGQPQVTPASYTQGVGVDPGSVQQGPNNVNVTYQSQQGPVSQMGRPSFMQAQQPLGGDLTNPALSKGGKLISFLLRAGQGALAGRAASEQALAQSGGHVAGGAGMGFQAAQTAAMQRAEMPLQYQQQAQQTALGQAGMSPVQTPYGQIPAALAIKSVLPWMIRGQSELGAANIKAQGQVQAAEIGKRFIPVQGVGLFDAQSRQVIPGTQQGITITPEIADDYQLPSQFVGKPMSLQNLASVQRSSVFENMPQMTAQGPIIVNRRTAQASPVSGPGGQRYSPPALASPREVGDEANPGQTKTVSGLTAIATGAPGVQSASVQVPKKAAASEVPANIGDRTVAFNTMLAHAQLLRQAAKAMDNGDVRTLAGLKNRLNTEFGDADYTNIQAIANAYNHEVTDVISKGHIDDTEVKKGERTLPVDANYKTIDKVLSSYENLARSKMAQLKQQKQSAISSSQKTQRFTDAGVIYNIPTSMINEFKKDHPNAR